MLGEGGFSFVYMCQDETSGVSLTWTFTTLSGHVADGVSLEGIRSEEDKVSDWFRRCEAGYEGSGGLQEIQVRLLLHSSPSTSGFNQNLNGLLGIRISFAFS